MNIANTKCEVKASISPVYAWLLFPPPTRSFLNMCSWGRMDTLSRYMEMAQATSTHPLPLR